MKIVSLFAGCGGLDYGFERAGFDVIWANEFDKTIHDTYRHNHPKTILNTKDIRTLSGDDIPECDGIIGGPPCQAWSEGGKQKGIEDPRGQLFLDYIRIVKEKQPKFFLIENVKGILHEKHKESLNLFIQSLEEAGYNVTYELLNAADYKIPQDRFRVFFIGIRKDLKNKYIFPDAVTTDPITLQQAIGDITETPCYFGEAKMSEGNRKRNNHDVYVGSFDAKYMARNRVRSWNETSFTMQAQARNAPLHPQAPKMIFVNSELRQFAKGYEHLYRRLSVRECARIQTFPDSFLFIYSYVTDGYKMVGNAVPPRLSWYLAIQMKLAFADMFNMSKEECRKIEKENASPAPQKVSVSKIKEESLDDVVVNNSTLSAETTGLDISKNVLVGLVKPENIEHYILKQTKIYYTGKHFPSSVALNKLYYFMPYIKGKGIKDLYLVKVARVGSKYEFCPNCDKDDLRLVFEIEFIKELFDEYKPIHLNIWHTFTDTTLSKLVMIDE